MKQVALEKCYFQKQKNVRNFQSPLYVHLWVLGKFWRDGWLLPALIQVNLYYFYIKGLLST